MLHNPEPLTFAPVDGQTEPIAPPALFVDYAHHIHPSTATEVVFCPGDSIPDWFYSPSAWVALWEAARLPRMTPENVA